METNNLKCMETDALLKRVVCTRSSIKRDREAKCTHKDGCEASNHGFISCLGVIMKGVCSSSSSIPFVCNLCSFRFRHDDVLPLASSLCCFSTGPLKGRQAVHRGEAIPIFIG